MKFLLLLPFALCFVVFSSFAQKKEIKLAQTHLASKDYAKAESTINSVINTPKGKTEPTAWIVRGDVYSELAKSTSDLTSAKTAYDSYVKAESLGKQGDCTEQLSNLTQTCLNQGYVKEGGKSYSQAIEWYSVGEQCMSKASPSDAQFTARLAQCYFMTENYTESIAHYKRCIENDYLVADCFIGIDYCYGMSYDFTPEMRVANMEEALKKLPENERILSIASDAYVSAGQFEKAVGVLDKLIQLYPESPNSYFVYGNATNDAFRYFSKQGKPEKAQEYFTKAESNYLKADKLLPNNLSIQYGLGTLYYMRAIDYQNAMNELGFSKEDQKKHEELAKLQKDYFKQALPYLETAYFKGASDDKSLLSTLKTIYLSLDMNEEYQIIVGK